MEVFERLADRIRAAADGRTIVYIPGSGNYGDGLIRYATKAFFQDHAIDHIEVNVSFQQGLIALMPLLLRRDRYLFVYGGGGAWSRVYDKGKRRVDFLSRFTRNILVLPSTYELAPARSAGIFFRRDEDESRATMPDSHFCHDMAFYLANTPIAYKAAADGPIGNLFRTDRESNRGGVGLPVDNIDISTLGNHMSNGDALLARIARYSAINTDRLHMAVSGALVGCDVTLYAGNYFKIRAIHSASLSTIFPARVRFVEDASKTL